MSASTSHTPGLQHTSAALLPQRAAPAMCCAQQHWWGPCNICRQVHICHSGPDINLTGARGASLGLCLCHLVCMLDVIILKIIGACRAALQRLSGLLLTKLLFPQLPEHALYVLILAIA